MGGDHAPREVVRGALDAARGVDGLKRLTLVGDAEAIRREIAAAGGMGSDAIDIRPATEQIGMDETPAQAVRRKKDSSIGRAVDMVKAGEADAVVSAGNTGAVVVAATLKLRTLTGVERPAIAAVMPARARPFVLVDAGANIDSDATLLRQFAVMGAVYARCILGRDNPTIGLLSIGGEATKGNETTKAAFRLLSDSPLNFRGNIEGHDLFRGAVDVAVCDGFVGNVVLKTSESAAGAIAHWMREEFQKTPIRRLGAGLLYGALRSMKRRLDPEMYGGALLLGVRGVCIITHGASSSRAIYHAVRVACESVNQHVNDVIIREIAGLGGEERGGQ
jgi:phosphate acyltransferase